jgi:hypothetical protein
MKSFIKFFTKHWHRIAIIIIACIIILYLAITYIYPSSYNIEGFSPSVKTDIQKQLDTYNTGIETASKVIIDTITQKVKKNTDANNAPATDRYGRPIPKPSVSDADKLTQKIIDSILNPILTDDSIKTNQLKIDNIYTKMKNINNLNKAEDNILMTIKKHYVLRYETTLLMLETLNDYKMKDRFPEDTGFISILSDQTTAIMQIVSGKQSVYNTINNYILEDTSDETS